MGSALPTQIIAVIINRRRFFHISSCPQTTKTCLVLHPDNVHVAGLVTGKGGNENREAEGIELCPIAAMTSEPESAVGRRCHMLASYRLHVVQVRS